MSVYQLRKIGLPASVEKVKNCYRITSNTTLIGRGQSVDVFLDSNIRKGLISRAHAQIIQKENGVDDEPVYEIFDTSLNGTYVNDVRINGSVILKDGDAVAFGHLRGSLIEPGTKAPQKETEFLFKFEKCLHPENKEEMVDLTAKELNNNSSVFMSPKSPVENHNPLIALSSGPLLRDEQPPAEKKVKFAASQNHVEIKKMYMNDEEDLKAVVAVATSKIKYNGDTSDDGNFQVELLNDVASEQMVTTGPLQLLHPRCKVIPPSYLKQDSLSPSYLNNPLHPNPTRNIPTAADQRHVTKNGNIKGTKNKKKTIERVNGVLDSDESEIESESESEYLEDSGSDSEKSEEIPDDSSDNEYHPTGKPEIGGNRKSATSKKQTPVAPVRLKPPPPPQEKSSQPLSVNDIKTHAAAVAHAKANNAASKKRKNSFTHDKCDSMNCRVPSGKIKTVTWVQCDDCDAWYHVSCSGLSIADVKKKDSVFHCGCS